KVLDSEELWSPRWSPDGRYIVANTRAGDRLMLFDFKTQKWTELAKTRINLWPEWSREGKYIYFPSAPGVGQPGGVFRVRISDHKLEQVVSPRDLRDLRVVDGSWAGLAPDDSLLFLRDVRTQDIYALDWEAP